MTSRHETHELLRKSLHIALGPLGAADAEALVCHALGVDALPTGVGAFIAHRAEGNPFFSEQLAYALRDAGHLIVDGRASSLAVGLTDLESLDIPDSVHGVASFCLRSGCHNNLASGPRQFKRGMPADAAVRSSYHCQSAVQ